MEGPFGKLGPSVPRLNDVPKPGSEFTPAMRTELGLFLFLAGELPAAMKTENLHLFGEVPTTSRTKLRPLRNNPFTP